MGFGQQGFDETVEQKSLERVRKKRGRGYHEAKKQGREENGRKGSHN